jgi:hypothetical protein
MIALKQIIKKPFPLLALIVIGFSFLGQISSVTVSSQPTGISPDPLNILGDLCLWPGQPSANPSIVCTEDNAIVFQIWDFLIIFSTVIASVVFVIAAYFFITGQEEAGRKLLRNGIYGLVVVLSASTIANLVKQTFSTPASINSNPIVNTLATIVTSLIVPLTGVLAAAFFVVGAYYIITAQGNSSRVSAGWSYMRNSLLAVVFALLSFAVIQVVYGFVSTLA